MVQYFFIYSPVFTHFKMFVLHNRESLSRRGRESRFNGCGSMPDKNATFDIFSHPQTVDEESGEEADAVEIDYWRNQQAMEKFAHTLFVLSVD